MSLHFTMQKRRALLETIIKRVVIFAEQSRRRRQQHDPSGRRRSRKDDVSSHGGHHLRPSLQRIHARLLDVADYNVTPPRASDVLRAVASAAALNCSVMTVPGPYQGSSTLSKVCQVGMSCSCWTRLATFMSVPTNRQQSRPLTGWSRWGSSRNTLRLSLARHRASLNAFFPVEGNPWAQQGFRTLNNSVYLLRHVYPIRTISGVKAYLTNRFPELANDAENVLHVTGGAGVRCKLCGKVWFCDRFAEEVWHDFIKRSAPAHVDDALLSGAGAPHPLSTKGRQLMRWAFSPSRTQSSARD
eukprot:Opistho-2@71961